MNKRIYYIDNLRWILVVLLIPFHIAMAYNTWDEANYIFFQENQWISSFICAVWPWFMPTLFLLAGISTRLSLNKRTYTQFLIERVSRLLVPFIVGVILVVPIQCYIADVFHNDYSEGFLMHYVKFFTSITDFTGYDGSFTIGHLWFLIILFLISVLCLLLIRVRKECNSNMLIYLLIWTIVTLDVKIVGKSILSYIGIYLLGYYGFSQEKLVVKLVRYRKLLLGAFLISTVGDVYLFIFLKKFPTLNNAFMAVSCITGVATMIVYASIYLNFSGKVYVLMKKLSFIIYIIHFPISLAFQYIFYLMGINNYVNLVLSLICGSVATLVVAYGLTRLKRIIRINPIGKFTTKEI